MMYRITPLFPAALLLSISLFQVKVSAALPPTLNITKCFGLGLENLTPQDILEITNVFNLDDPNIQRNTIQLINAAGYPSETHTVTTKDGYVLTMFRIPYRKNETFPAPGRPVVLMQHGLTASSDQWLLNYPNKNLPYRLVDLGYDVFLTNSRGNKYSRTHTSLNPNSPLSQYWDFSWHEMGKNDVPKNIDYILGITKQPKLYYIGHSQGTTQYFVGMSLDETMSYNSKIRLMVALAPIAYMNNSYSLLSNLGPLSVPGLPDDLLCAIGTDGTGQAQGAGIQNKLTPYGCNSAITTNLICNSVVFLLLGYDYCQSQNELVPSLVGHYPAGAPMKSYIHYMQLIKNGRFQQFDYGPKLALLDPLRLLLNQTYPSWLANNIAGGNQAKYNSNIVPIYNLSRITAPVVLYVGRNDAFANVVDVARLAPQIPGNIDINNASSKFRQVPFECFNHGDFCGIARGVNELLYNDVIALLPQY